MRGFVFDFAHFVLTVAVEILGLGFDLLFDFVEDVSQEVVLYSVDSLVLLDRSRVKIFLVRITMVDSKP